MPLPQLRALLPLEQWVWSATYVTIRHSTITPDGMRGLHAVTAISAANLSAQLYVSEAEAVFKNVCGQDGDFLKSMPTEEEEEAAVMPPIPAAQTDTETSLHALSPAHVLEESSFVSSSIAPAAAAAMQSN